MKLDLQTIGTLYRSELKMSLRDNRTVFFSILLPILIMPLLLFLGRIAEKKRETELQSMTHSIAVVGSGVETATQWIRDAIEKQGEAAAAEKNDRARFEIEELEADGVPDALARGRLSLYILAEMDVRDEDVAVHGRKHDAESPGIPRLTLVYRGDRDASQQAAQVLRRRLVHVRNHARSQLLAERGFPVSMSDVGRLSVTSVASDSQVSGLALGRFLTAFLLMFVFMGGAVIATDSLAGEKERGTLETLLATAAGRGEIICAKSLLTLTSAVVITAIQAVNFLVYVVFRIVPTTIDPSAAVTPATTALLFLLYLPVIALVSSALLATSGLARTYKEAQLYFMPIMLLGLLPAMAPIMPGIHLESAIMIVPIANIAVAVKEILVGTYHWPAIVVSWLTTAAAAAGTGWLTARMLRTERLVVSASLSREEHMGGPEIFPRRVLRAFAIMWAAMIFVSIYLAESVRSQLLCNVGIVFVGGSIFIIWRYRLDAKKALALRPVRPAVWLGVIAGVPGGLVTAIGIARISNLWLPAPEEWLKAFSRSLLPEDVPLWQLLLLLTVLPGIGEEITFRGVLLHGLRKRMHPIVLTLVVGAIFGFFHASLWRLAPTGFLGVLFTAVTLLTGSIFPAMLWHALNNGCGLFAGLAGLPLDRIGWKIHGCGIMLLAVAFWIFWRCRSPYPDLRTKDIRPKK